MVYPRNDGRDPLERGIEISGLPILAKGILEGLAERLGCTRHDAAKFWAGILATTLPYVAPTPGCDRDASPGNAWFWSADPVGDD